MKLYRLRKRFRRKVFFPSRMTLPWSAYVRQRPFIFAVWFHARRLFFTLTHGLSAHQPEDRHSAQFVVPYNRARIGAVDRDRTERLMNVLRSIQGLDRASMRVLSLGPRNEAEILLLSLYGFDRRQITGVDLFSYSPLIRPMDMQHLDFRDDTFDLVYAAYTITYADKVETVCDEIMRVVRDGGLIALSFQHFTGGRLNFGRNPLNGGLNELFELFAGHVGHVYWREEYRHGDGVLCSTVFTVAKTR